MYVAQDHKPLRPSWAGFIVIVVLSLALAGRAIDADPVKPTPVVVLSGGDDGLTNRLSDALTKAFESSLDFKLSSVKKPGTLIVVIPTNVDSKYLKSQSSHSRTQERYLALYTVEFRSTDEGVLATMTGSCRDDRLAECAAQIIKGARAAVPKIHG